MNNKLLAYLPQTVYEDVKETQEITESLLPEVDSAWGGLERVRDNQFILTSDITRIRMWERLLRIRPNPIIQDLDYRKSVVLLRLGLSPPFTYNWLVRFLTDMAGEGNFIINLDHSSYTILIKVLRNETYLVNELRELLRETLPANLAITTANTEIKEVNKARNKIITLVKTHRTFITTAKQRVFKTSATLETASVTAVRELYISNPM